MRDDITAWMGSRGAAHSLLFWLSLTPFFSGWMGENHFETLPVALSGSVLLMCGLSYLILARALVAHHGAASALAQAMTLLLCACAVPFGHAPEDPPVTEGTVLCRQGEPSDAIGLVAAMVPGGDHGLQRERRSVIATP